MLKNLKLENFQAHAKLVVPIGPGVTSIVGPTDAGKSSVLRALRWLCLADMPNTGLCRHGANSMHVSLEVDNTTVARVADTKGNRYHMGDKTWSAIRGTIPEEALNRLAMPSVCWQAQHDSPFWLSASAAAVGRELCQVVDLGVIAKAMATANSLGLEATARDKAAAAALDLAAAAAQALRWVAVMAVDWEDVQYKNEEAVAACAMASRLRQAATTATAAAARAATAAQAANMAKGVYTAGQAYYAAAQHLGACEGSLEAWQAWLTKSYKEREMAECEAAAKLVYTKGAKAIAARERASLLAERVAAAEGLARRAAAYPVVAQVQAAGELYKAAQEKAMELGRFCESLASARLKSVSAQLAEERAAKEITGTCTECGRPLHDSNCDPVQ